MQQRGDVARVVQAGLPVVGPAGREQVVACLDAVQCHLVLAQPAHKRGGPAQARLDGELSAKQGRLVVWRGGGILSRRAVRQPRLAPAVSLDAVFCRDRRARRDVTAPGDDFKLAEGKGVDGRIALPEFDGGDADIARRGPLAGNGDRRDAGTGEVRRRPVGQHGRRGEIGRGGRLDLEAQREAEAVMAIVPHGNQAHRRDGCRPAQIHLHPFDVVFERRLGGVVADGFSGRRLGGDADPLRLPVLRREHPHRPAGRLTPGGRPAVLVPEAHLPEHLLGRMERLSRVENIQAPVGSDRAAVPEVAVSERQRRGGGRRQNLIGRLAQAPRGGIVRGDDPAEARLCHIHAERPAAILALQLGRRHGGGNGRVSHGEK